VHADLGFLALADHSLAAVHHIFVIIQLADLGEDFGKALAAWLSDGTPAKPYEVEERAAIMEHDGGLPRQQAERMAERQEATVERSLADWIRIHIAEASNGRSLIKMRERVEQLGTEGQLSVEEVEEFFTSIDNKLAASTAA
jgi:hypothetical protein